MTVVQTDDALSSSPHGVFNRGRWTGYLGCGGWLDPLDVAVALRIGRGTCRQPREQVQSLC